MSYIEFFRKRNRVRNNILDLFNKHLYLMVETSYFEPYDEFIKCIGRTDKDKTVKVINNNGSIEILRPDITFNIIKDLSKEFSEPLKVYYDSTVFENEKKGIRERRQMGAECLGNMSIEADIEMIRLSIKVLDMIDESVVVIGHTRYLNGLLKEILDLDTRRRIKLMIYKKQPQLLKELLMTIDIDETIKVKIMDLVEVKPFDLNNFTNGYLNTEMKMAISEISYLMKAIDEPVSFDFSLLSKFEYYDGIIFKGYVKGLNSPVIRGGRYDRLSAMFDTSIPAVGFSIEFDDLVRSVK